MCSQVDKEGLERLASFPRFLVFDGIIDATPVAGDSWWIACGLRIKSKD